MVRIFHKPLILLRQSLHDGGITFCHHLFDGLGPLAWLLDGFVNHQTKRMPLEEVKSLLTGQYVKSAIDGYRYHRQLQFVSQLECSATENTHMTSERASPFGKDHQTDTSSQDTACMVVSPLDTLGATLVHEDMSAALTCFPHQRHLAQLLFHHPSEMTVEESIYEEDIIWPLMIGHKYVGLLGVKLLSALHMYGKQHHLAHESSPDMSRPVSPEGGTSYGAPYDGNETGEDGGYEQHGKCYKQLIQAI